MDEDTVTLATELTVAWLSNANNRITTEEVPVFLRSMHDTLNALSAGSTPVEDAPGQAVYEPAVSVRKSLASRDHIISLIDGKPYRTLRRHLSGHGLSPEQYRERFGLKSDYPMVAPSYSESRRDMAKRIGLGRKTAESTSDVDTTSEPVEDKAPIKRGRKPSGVDALKSVRAKSAKSSPNDPADDKSDD